MHKRVLRKVASFIALLSCSATTALVAQSPIVKINKASPQPEETAMTTASAKTAQLPPEVARYLRDTTPDNRQFDFLIGNWDVDASRYKPDLSLLMQYKAKWTARYLNGGRMVFDDFKALTPTGEEASSFVTLRTYSEAHHRWEMAGLAALQPQVVAEWYGEWKDGEMLTEVIAKGPGGNPVRNRIRFFSIQQDHFSWESKVSLDDGKTWTQVASLTATRSHP